MVPEVSVAERHAVWSLFRASIGELQKRPLVFGVLGLKVYATIPWPIWLTSMAALPTDAPTSYIY